MADGTQIRITAVDQTTAAFRSVQSNISSLQGTLRGIAGPLAAAFSVAGIAAFAKSVIDLQDRLYDVSQQTGIAVETLSALGNAAKVNGSSVEQVTEGFKKLSRAIVDAKTGSKEQTIAFEALGISADDLRNLKTEDVFYKIADAFQQTATDADKVEVAARLLGKSVGPDLIPLLNEGSAALKKFGASFTTEDAKRASEFNDSIDKLVINLQGLASTLLGPVLKGINSFFASLAAGNKILKADTQGLVGTFEAEAGAMMEALNPAVAASVRAHNELVLETNKANEAKKEAIKNSINLAARLEEEKRITERLTARNQELVEVFKFVRQPIDDYQERVLQLNTLLSEGTITLDMYYNGMEKVEEAYARTLPKVELNDTALKRYRETIRDTEMALDNMAVRALVNLEESLLRVMTGTMSVKDAFRSMAISIIEDLIRIQIRRSIVGPIADAISGAFSSGSSSAYMGGIKVPGKALGGTTQAGQAYMVGEKGPELFIPGRTGSVVPNNQLGGSGAVVNQTINISTGVSQTVRAEIVNMLPRIMESTKAAIADSRRRGGGFAKMMGT